MSYYDRKYRDMDLSHDKITHSTPKKSKDEYGGVVSSSYTPQQLSTTNENHSSGLQQHENVSVKSGVTRTVTQSVKKSSASSTKSSGYSSEEGRKEDDMANSDILNSRISGAVGSSMGVESYSSSDYDKSARVDRSKPTDLGFQYEDIQSFKERQKVEGDRLQMHRQSLTGNIVGTGKHGVMQREFTSSSESKPNDSDTTTSYSSRITHYKSSSNNDPLSRENLLAEARGRINELSVVQSNSSQGGHLTRDGSVTNEDNKGLTTNYTSSNEVTYTNKSSRSKEDITSSEDPLSRYGNTRDSALHSSRYTSEISRSREDILGSRDSEPLSRNGLLTEERNKDLGLRSSRYSSALSSSKEDILSSRKDNDSLSRDAEARNQAAGSQSSFRYSKDISRSKEDLIGGPSKDNLLSRALSGSDSRLHTRGILDDKHDDLRVPQEDRFSRSDALVAKYLHSSRYKGLSKHGSEPELDVRSHHSPLTGIKEELRDDNVKKDSEVRHHSSGGKPMSYLPSSSSYEDLLQRKRESVADSKPGESSPGITRETNYSSRYKYGDLSSPKPNRETSVSSSDISKRLSTEIRDERKSRQDAIDRLLQSTRRYSSENILDQKSHDRNLDDVLGAMTTKDLDTSKKYEIDKDERSYLGARNDREAGGMSPRERGSQEISDADRHGLARDLRDKTRHPGPHENEAMRQGVTTRDERVRRYNESSSYETPYTSLDHSYKSTFYDGDGPIYDQPDGLERGQRPGSMAKTPDGQVIYDKLRRGSGQADNVPHDPRHIDPNALNKRRGSKEEPLYDHLNSSGLKPSRGHSSPVPMSDKYSLPLDKYDKPVAIHGRSQDPYRPDNTRGKEIVSKYPDPRDFGLTDYVTDSGVTETTRTSYMERTFMSRDGEVIKDETRQHEEVHHGGQNAIEGTDHRGSKTDFPTRIQRYPPAKTNDVSNDQRPSNTPRSTEAHPSEKNSRLDDILKKTGIDIGDSGNATNFQKQSRRDEITRVSDNSNVRTKVHRTDVNTNVNIVKEVVTERKKKPKESSARSGIAGLRAKIEALNKSVDELMNYKHKTLLQTYVQEHGNRRPSKDLEALPKPENYEVKSKRYEPDIKLDEVDYVHKEVEIDLSSQKPDIHREELNLENMWVTKDKQGLDIGVHIPNQINLEGDKGMEWWNAPTAEDADRFLCIGDWQWWNANTTEGVDHLLGVRAINKETGAAGAIIAKYQGDEKPIEYAWLQASQQPSPTQKRRTLTRAFMKNKKVPDEWWDAPTAEDADKHLSIGHYKWWDENKTEGVEKVLGVQGSADETGTILATYEGGTKPTAWTWVQTSEQPAENQEERSHTIRRSSRDVYIDETDKGNVELLVRVKDEETTTPQQPRYLAIRPGPIEKAIIIREVVESDIPPYASDVTVEGKSGEGLQIQDGVVKMRIKDMTPEARKAWVDIMGMEKKKFKLKDNETLEIPVKVVDRQKPREDIYAVPMKKNKKSQKATSDDKPTIPSRETPSEKKKKELKAKEIEKERKKQEQKAKKLEEQRRKEEKESIKKKAKEKESQKKKKEMESIKKKKEAESVKKKEAGTQKKKKETEKVKERESEKRKKEQSVKKGSASSVKEKVNIEKVGPPTIDRSLKPKADGVMHETHTQETSYSRRSSSDVVDSNPSSNIRRGSNKQMSHIQVTAVHHEGSETGHPATKVATGSHSPIRKPGPFALSNKNDRPQTTRGRIITTQNQSKSVRTVFDERSSPPKRPSASVRVVSRVNNTQFAADKTDNVKNKSGNIQRRSGGSQVVVPLRGGSKSPDGNGYAVIQHQRSQSQKVPVQHNIKQTRVEKTYRTETKVIDSSNPSIPQNVQHHIPLKGSVSDSQMHMIHKDPFNTAPVVRHKETHVVENRVLNRRPSGDPFNTVPVERHKKETHIVEKRVLDRRSSAELLDSANLERRGSGGHSVTNVSVTSQTSQNQPSVVQKVRHSSGDPFNTVPLDRRGSGHSVTNLSVTSRTSKDKPNVVQIGHRTSVEKDIGRRGSGHSVTNLSVTRRKSEGRPNVIQMGRRSSNDKVVGVPMERRGSGHNVTNVSVSSHTVEGQPNVQVRRQSGDDQKNGVPMDRRGSSHSVRNLAVTSRTITEVQPTCDVIKPDNSQATDVVRLNRRVSGDPWKTDVQTTQSRGGNHDVIGEHPSTSYFREEKQSPNEYMKREIIRKTTWSEQ